MTDRLNRDDWLDAGLRALAEDGPAALRADRLARALGVSRGSFYWHFRDIGAYEDAILAAWHTRATLQVIADLEGAVLGPERLAQLMRRAFSSDTRLERAIRSWAAQDARAAEAVARVDAGRTDYLATLLRASGLAGSRVRSRAVFLYLAHIGRVMSAGDAALDLDAVEIDAIAALLQR